MSRRGGGGGDHQPTDDEHRGGVARRGGPSPRPRKRPRPHTASRNLSRPVRGLDAAGFEHLLDAQAAAASAMTTLAGAIKTYVGTREDHRSRMLLHGRSGSLTRPPPRRARGPAHGPGRVRRRPRGAPPRARAGLGRLFRPGRRAPRRVHRERGESGADDRAGGAPSVTAFP